MSDSTVSNAMAYAPSAGLTMTSETRADLSARADQFSNLLASGAATKDQLMDGVSNLASGTQQAMRNAYNGNSSGLDQHSYRSLQGANDQLGDLKFKMVNGQDVSKQLLDLTNAIKSELNPASAAQQAGGPQQGADSQAGTQGQILQVMQMLMQLIQQMAGNGAGGGDEALGAAQAPGAEGKGGIQQKMGEVSNLLQQLGGQGADKGDASGTTGKIIELLQQLVQQTGGQGVDGATGAPKGGELPAAPLSQKSGDPSNQGNVGEVLKLLQQLVQQMGGQSADGAAGAPQDGAARAAPQSPAADAPQGVGGEGGMQQMMQMMQMMMQIMMQMMQQQMGGAGSGMQAQATD